MFVELLLGGAAIGGMALMALVKPEVGSDQLDARGIVPGDPEALAKAAGVSLDVYALARCGQSEESSSAARTAVMWAARNAASVEGVSVARLLLRSNTAAADGYFGTQGGRFASTSKAPTSTTLGLAKKVLAGTVADPTGGAVRWDAPVTQALLHAQNPTKYRPPEEIAARREGEGYSVVWVPGVTTTRFWRS